MINFFRKIVEKSRKSRLRSIGPGIIAGSSGNDAGGIASYSIVGAAYGYKILWLLVVSLPILIVLNDMSARLAVSAKQGLGSLIRREYGARIALILMIAFFVSNAAIVAANLAGMAVSIELITSIDYRIFIIPFTALVWYIVVKGGYAKVEKILLLLSLGLLAYVVVAFIAAPVLIEVVIGSLIPSIEINTAFFVTAVGIVGATVSPYIYFYYTSAEIEKTRVEEDINATRVDAGIGALWSGIISYFILLTAAAVLFTSGINDVNTAKDAAMALKPLAGDFAFLLFAIGLFAGSTIASAVLPVSTAYAITETFGLESGLNKKIKEARLFYGIFTLSLIVGAGLLMIGIDPIQTMFVSMVISGILTPVVLYLLMKMCNDENVLGQYTNNMLTNLVGWAAVALSSILVIIMFITLAFPI